MAERTGVYPGTFDPITNGHVDIISRAARLVDRLVIGVARNIGKSPLFPLDERVDLVQRECAAISARSGTRIDVVSFDTLLIDFVRGAGRAQRHKCGGQDQGSSQHQASPLSFAMRA